MTSPAPQNSSEHASGVDDDPQYRFLFPVPFSMWVSSIQRYRVILAERRSFTRQLRHLLDLDATVRTTHPVNLHHYCRPELHAGKIAYFSFTGIVRVLQPATTSGTHQLPIAALPPDPQPQGFCLLVDFMPVDSVARPSQQLGQFAVSQTAECTEIGRIAKATPA